MSKKKKTRAERIQRIMSIIILVSIIGGVVVSLGTTLYNYF